jgi:hypothetical protein
LFEALIDPAAGATLADGVSALLLRTCEFVDNRHTTVAEEVLWDLCDTVSRTGAAIGRHSSAELVLGVEHAQLLAGAGYSKADAQRWMYEHAVRSHADLERAGAWSRTAYPMDRVRTGGPSS